MPPTIGLIARHENRVSLAHELGRYGINLAPIAFDPSSVDGVLIEAACLNEDREEWPDLTTVLNNSSFQLCALLLNSNGLAPEPEGMTLTPSVAAFAQQLKLFLRSRDILAEAKLRQQTLASLNAPYPEASSAEKLDQTILYFGEPGRFYLKLKSALQLRGKKVSAVLSERTAFEAFRSFVPSAFVVSVSEDFYPFELLDHIQGRTDLKNMPVIAVSQLNDRLPDDLKNIHGLVRLNSEFGKSITAIERLIDKSKTPDPIAAKYCASPARDKYCGCFSETFARQHIEAQAQKARLDQTPLCVAKIQPLSLETRETLAVEQLAQFSSLMSSVLRAQDMMARMSWSEFLISFPATDKRAAEDALQRALRILEMTQISNNVRPSFRAEMFEYADHLSSAQFWSRITSGQVRRQRQANVA